MAEYSLTQLEELQAAVDATPPAHRCPMERLWLCSDHPKWRVVATDIPDGAWWVLAPGPELQAGTDLPAPLFPREQGAGRWPAPTHQAALGLLRDKQLEALEAQPQEAPC